MSNNDSKVIAPQTQAQQEQSIDIVALMQQVKDLNASLQAIQAQQAEYASAAEQYRQRAIHAENQVAILKAEEAEKINDRIEKFEKRSLPGKAWNATSRSLDLGFRAIDLAIEGFDETTGLGRKYIKEVAKNVDSNLAEWTTEGRIDTWKEACRSCGKVIPMDKITDVPYLLAAKMAKAEEELLKEFAKKK